MIALVDCNNFFVSCERVFRPDLNNKPVVVLSNNDGCIISRSNEAKKLQIPMGAPLFKYEQYLKDNNVNVFSSNYVLYGDLSQRVMSTLALFTTKLEVYSIDEAFLDLSGLGCFGNLKDYGVKIRKAVLKNIGIPTSVGIAPTKTLAKIAANIAKKYPQLLGAYSLDSAEKIEKALKWTPIKDVWGIGRGYLKKMEQWDIKTAYDFTLLTNEFVKQNMGIQGLRVKKELGGRPCILIDNKTSHRKAIATTRTFSSSIQDLEKLEQVVSNFAINCAVKLRKEKTCCNCLTVYLKTDKHRTSHKQYNKKIAISFPNYTNSNIDIAHYAKKGLQAIYQKGYKYKRAGVVLYGIVPETSMQLNMFYSTVKHRKLMKAIDDLNKKIGNHKIRLASQGIGKVWQMKQEKLSPKYSTHWTDLIEVKV